MLIQRPTYLNQIVSKKGNGLIKIISGLRRCGKSYLLFKLFKKHLIASGVSPDKIITIELDDFKQAQYRNPKTCYDFVSSRIKGRGKYFLLLDEVQMMDKFEDVLNGFLHIENLDTYVTGSNSRFLSSDIVTEFRGRSDEIRVHPLSFEEFYSAKKWNWNDAWREYSTFGGLPYILSLKTRNEKIKYLKKLEKETYLRDLIERNKIKNDAEFEELLAILASAIGSPTNPLKLQNSFKRLKNVNITSPTIKKFLDYIQDAFIISKSMRYDVKGKKYINTPSKYYFTDIGLRNSILDFRQQELSHIMENVIYNELLLRGFSVDVGAIDVLEKNNASYKKITTEIDFVANKGDLKYYIQSAYSIPDEQKREQEIRPLRNAKDSFKKVVITYDDINPYFDENGIFTIGLKDFLLNENSLEYSA